MLSAITISALVIFSGYLVTGDRILLVGIQLYSHLLQLQEIGEVLVRHGNSVYYTIDERFPKWEKLSKPGITAVTFRGTDTNIPHFWSKRAERQLISVIMGKRKPNPTILMEIIMQDCSNMMNDEAFLSKVMALKFDLVLYSGFFFCPCNVILGRYLLIPTVAVTSEMNIWRARVPINPAVTPYVMLQHSDRMTFFQRLTNVALYLVASMRPMFEQNKTLLERFAPEVNSWTELQQRSTVLYIVTRDYLLEWPEPTMPNIIQTSAVTTHPAGALPQQLNKLMNAGNHGVIILSFGSITGQLPAEVINKLLDAFSQVNQTVIFKWGGGSDSTLPSNVPRNVHLFSWLPQNDLLGHPNTVLFITHCGNNGQYESLYHGVPMIGFPLFGDQHHNAFRMVHHGYGVKMNIREFTVDELVNNIHKVLEEKSFKMAIQKASDIVKSRPMTAQDTAAYWVEHVLKYGGEHLRTGAMDMPLYQFLMLDILLFVLVVCFLSIYILKITFAVIFQKCLRKKIKQKRQ